MQVRQAVKDPEKAKRQQLQMRQQGLDWQAARQQHLQNSTAALRCLQHLMQLALCQPLGCLLSAF